MNFKEIGVNTRNWVDSVQDRDYWRALVDVTSDYGVHEVGVTVCGVQHVLGVRVRP